MEVARPAGGSGDRSGGHGGSARSTGGAQNDALGHLLGGGAAGRGARYRRRSRPARRGDRRRARAAGRRSRGLVRGHRPARPVPPARHREEIADGISDRRGRAEMRSSPTSWVSAGRSSSSTAATPTTPDASPRDRRRRCSTPTGTTSPGWWRCPRLVPGAVAAKITELALPPLSRPARPSCSSRTGGRDGRRFPRILADVRRPWTRRGPGAWSRRSRPSACRRWRRTRPAAASGWSWALSSRWFPRPALQASVAVCPASSCCGSGTYSTT